MSFFRIHTIRNNKQVKNQAFLRAKIFYSNKSTNKIKSIKKFEKRISLFPFSKCKASMAVEASLVIPLFLFFTVNILTVFDILRLHSNLMGAMHQTGNRMAFYGYACKNITEEDLLQTSGLTSVIMSEGYVRTKVISRLGTDYLDNTCLASGTSGLHFTQSSLMGGDIIDLIASYKVKPFTKIMGFPEFAMENRYYGRAWTGYDVERKNGDISKEDPIVYVADTGVVYHMVRSCPYLSPSVDMVSSAGLERMRNEQGEKYYACERCKGNILQSVLYITLQGNRYHESLNCSGLKRTVYMIHLSETGGKRKCSKCG